MIEAIVGPHSQCHLTIGFHVLAIPMPPAILIPTNVILTKFINIPPESIIVPIMKLAFKEPFLLLNSPYNTARLALVVDLAIE